LGGEKLNTTRFVFFTALIVGIILIQFPISAQEADDTLPIATEEIPQERRATVSEETIVFGEQAITESTLGNTSAWDIFRVIIVLALAGLAIYGVVFFIKRLSRPSKARDPNLKVLATLPLGSDSFAAVVSVGKKAWLVGGGTGAGLRLIAEIDEQEALETMLLDEAQKNAETGTGRILDFRAMLNRLGNANNSKPGLGSHADSLKKQRDRLKGL
jgi:flagellar protein FliO/FliZ